MNQQANKKNRRVLWILIALFLGPLVLAWVLYFSGTWRPGGQAHHGSLVDPAINISKQLDATTASVFDGKWTLLQVIKDSCDESCRELEKRLGQVRLALGHRRDRVQRVVLKVDNSELPKFEDPALVSLNLDAKSSFVEILEMNKQTTIEGSVFVTDPLGNLVMVYSSQVEQRALMEDLKRLLRLSRIG